MIIQKKTVLLPAGSRKQLKVLLASPCSLTWGINKLTLKNGVTSGRVSWGDGSSDIVTAENAQKLTHTYAAYGTYVVTLSDDFKSLGVSCGMGSEPFKSEYPARVTAVLEGAPGLSLDGYCFANATRLETFTANKQFPTSLGSAVFEGCTGLAHIELPGVASLNAHVFNECTYLREIHLSGEYEASIRASSAWSSSNGKFGAPNAETSFDLP